MGFAHAQIDGTVLEFAWQLFQTITHFYGWKKIMEKKDCCLGKHH